MPKFKPSFGRLVKSDPNDLKYPMRLAIRREMPAKTKYWNTGKVLNQGNTSSCVGQSWRQWLSSAPLMTSDGPSAMEIYQRALVIDEFPGEADEGTSVRAGAKAVVETGRVKSYVWAYDADTIREFILTTGTVIVGSNWYSGMMDTSLFGYVKPKGAFEGGHAYLLCGFSSFRNAFRIINSWGPNWGSGGRAWLRHEDLQKLLSENGEACAAIETKIVPIG